MATLETPPRTHDRPGRRRPFSTWMKKLANLKGHSSGDANTEPSGKRSPQTKSSNKKNSPLKKNSPSKNNPYPESGHMNGGTTSPGTRNASFATAPTGVTTSGSSAEQSRSSLRSSLDGLAPTDGNKSVAPTLSTEQDVPHSEAARSHCASSGEGTIATTGGGISTTGRGADSTFSSPAPSVRSLTTTLTTIQSAAAMPTNGGITHSHHNSHHGASSGRNDAQSIHFSHQFPASPPVSALPPHLAPTQSGGHPSTYNTATANNLLTDNASILTLASSSKRRRRRSMDTDASVRALAPSSVFGGSRESLPLSVLSSNVEGANPPTSYPRSTTGPAERASLYSTAGVAPALSSERNSYYANKQSIAGDGGSVKSGRLGHNKNDSITGSIGGMPVPSSPLAHPREGKLSRSNSAWGELDGSSTTEEKNEKAEKDKASADGAAK